MAFQHSVVGRIVQWDLQAKTMGLQHDIGRGAQRHELTSPFELDPHVTVMIEHHGGGRLADVHTGQLVTVHYVTAHGTYLAQEIIIADPHATNQQRVPSPRVSLTPKLA